MKSGISVVFHKVFTLSPSRPLVLSGISHNTHLMTCGLDKLWDLNYNGWLGCRPQPNRRLMQKQWVVAFKDIGQKYAEPEIYTCSATEQGDIQEVLDKVRNMGDGPIDSLSYKEFAFQAEPITLKELRERFADELAELDEDEECDTEEEAVVKD